MPCKVQNRALNSQEILAGAQRLKSKPLFFWFDLAGQCNLECKHCGFQVHGRTSDKDVSDHVYQTVVDELLPTAYVCNLGGTNWGEMTISPRFHPYLLDCKKHQVEVNLTTNGTRMSDDWFDDLLDVLTVIGFSMEGMEEEFEKMRGFKWRFFLKHVEKVCQGRADRNKKFRVEWRFCAHADNIHQLPDMIRLARSIGVDRIQVMNLVPYVPAQKLKMLYYHRSLANQYFRASREVARELNFDVSIPPDFGSGTFETTPLLQVGLPNKAPLIQTTCEEMVNCYYPWQTCSINELGVVKPCCVYWRSMGDLRKGFEPVWNGRRFRRLRTSVNTKPDHICYTCRKPRFDSDENKSAAQLMPGVREIVRNVLTIHRRKVSFLGILNPEYDPQVPGHNGRPQPSESGLSPAEGASRGPCCS